MLRPEDMAGMAFSDFVRLGLVEGLANEAYHESPGVSKTGLDHISKSAAHYVAYVQGNDKDTDAKRFGHLFHRFILEPDLCRLAVWDGPARNTKAGKEAWAEFLEKHQEHEVVSVDESRALEGMRASVYAHSAARNLLNISGRSELSRWSYDQRTGELCKVRPDRLLDIGMAFDLKSCKDASPRGFSKACAERRYHVQGAFYPDKLGLDEKRFPFIAVEKDPPYAVAVYELDPQAVEFGRYLYERDLIRLAECKISKQWPAYSEKIERLTLPAWATKEI
jgi:hypothetical protein